MMHVLLKASFSLAVLITSTIGDPFPIDDESLPLHTLYKWSQIDFQFPNHEEKIRMLDEGLFEPGNIIPLGLERWRDRIFISLPHGKPGSPVTLASVPVATGETSPLLEPYPSWSFHNRSEGDCSGLVSVFRMHIDPCGRMWVLDSGKVEAFTNPRQACPSKLVVFDLNNDKMIARHNLPLEYNEEGSFMSNIVTDTRDENCTDTHAYISDTRRFALIVFRFSDRKFWRMTHFTFLPDPLAANFTLHGQSFSWLDGIFSLSLSPLLSKTDDRIIFYHGMTGYKEFAVRSSVVRDPRKVDNNQFDFQYLGSRGFGGQVSAAAIDRDGVMFYNLISKDAIGCWDIYKPYRRSNLHVLAKNSETLIFPNDLRIDQEETQLVWILSNRLTILQFGPANPNTYNFRILYMYPKQAVWGTICDSSVLTGLSYPEADFQYNECY